MRQAIFQFLAYAIPTSLVLYWIYGKVCSTQKTRRIATIVTTVILNPLFYVLFFGLLMSIMTYEPKRKFDPDRWAKDPSSRYQMWDDMEHRQLLIGKDTVALKEMLGEPMNRYPSSWEYYMGSGGGGFGVRIHYLNCHISKGSVDSMSHSFVED